MGSAGSSLPLAPPAPAHRVAWREPPLSPKFRPCLVGCLPGVPVPGAQSMVPESGQWHICSWGLWTNRQHCDAEGRGGSLLPGRDALVTGFDFPLGRLGSAKGGAVPGAVKGGGSPSGSRRSPLTGPTCAGRRETGKSTGVRAARFLSVSRSDCSPGDVRSRGSQLQNKSVWGRGTKLVGGPAKWQVLGRPGAQPPRGGCRGSAAPRILIQSPGVGVGGGTRLPNTLQAM